jgi:hypothetical protein
MSRGEVESAIITSINAHQNSILGFASQNPSHKIICRYDWNNKGSIIQEGSILMKIPFTKKLMERRKGVRR